MKPVMQTTFRPEPGYDDTGNCFQACIASIFELSLDDLPNFCREEKWFDDTQTWLRERGLAAVSFREWIPPFGYAIVTGKSPRGEWGHSVVYCDGRMAHDPREGGEGVMLQSWEQAGETWGWESMVFMQLNPADLSRLTKLASAEDEAASDVCETVRQIIGSVIPWLRIVSEDCSDRYVAIGVIDQLRAMEKALQLCGDLRSRLSTLEREKQSAEERAEHWTSCAVRMDADIVALWQWMNANLGDELQAVTDAHKIPRDGESKGEPVWVCARDVMERLRAKLAAHEAVIGEDTPWPLANVLTQLIESAAHAHNVHDCDCDGWEKRSAACDRAKAIVAALEATRAGKTEGG